MRRRSWPVLVLTWCAVVALVATATWWAIDTAGRDVLAGPDSLDLPVATLGEPTATETTVPTRRPTPRPTPSPSGGSGSQTPSATAQPAPETPRPTATHSSEPEPSPQVTTQTRTWRGAAGTLVVQCRGRTISFKGATPADGWSVEIEDRGPGRVEVTFRRSGDSESEVQVRSECSDGVPVFDVEDHGGDDSG